MNSNFPFIVVVVVSLTILIGVQCQEATTGAETIAATEATTAGESTTGGESTTEGGESTTGSGSSTAASSSTKDPQTVTNPVGHVIADGYPSDGKDVYGPGIHQGPPLPPRPKPRKKVVVIWARPEVIGVDRPTVMRRRPANQQAMTIWRAAYERKPIE